MRLSYAAVLAGLFLSTALNAAAASPAMSPAMPQNGVDYLTLTRPHAVEAGAKQVEVIEFFMYHCPVCNGLEPRFEAWVNREGARIKVRRIHYPSTGPNDPEAHLYLTLDALGQLGALHEKVFHAVHVEHIRLNQEAAIIDWAAKNGVDRARFVEAWHSSSVTTRLRQLDKLVASYGVDSVPTLVIDGRYVVSPAIVSNSVHTEDRDVLFKATLGVADTLVNKAAQGK
jgi:thiol:disulfide interchange protein DsbA